MSVAYRAPESDPVASAAVAAEAAARVAAESAEAAARTAVDATKQDAATAATDTELAAEATARDAAIATHAGLKRSVHGIPSSVGSGQGLIGDGSGGWSAVDIATQTELDAETSARATADGALIPLSQKAAASGVASLGTDGRVPRAQMPLGSYNVMDPQFGAKGDGKRVKDGAITSGQPTLTSATAAFTSADVGKRIVVEGAGAAGANLSTTISGYTNATTVTLAANAGTSVTNAKVTYGTDDTAAIQAAIDAIPAALGGEVFAPALLFVVTASLLVQRAFVTVCGVNYGQRSIIYDDGAPGGTEFYATADIDILQIFTPSGATNRISGCVVRDIRLNGAGRGGTKAGINAFTNAAGVSSGYSHDSLLVENVTAINNGVGLVLNATDNTTVRGGFIGENGAGCQVKGTTLYPKFFGVGFWDNNAIGLDVQTGCISAKVLGCEVGRGTTGIQVAANCPGTQIVGNTVTGTTADGINVRESATCTITNNQVTSCASGSGIAIGTATAVVALVLANNTVRVCKWGVFFYAANTGKVSASSIVGNVCEGNARMGMLIDFIQDSTIQGNTAENNGTATNATYDNIEIGGNANTNNVQGNTTRMGAAANKARYGMRIDAGATSNLVTNNDNLTGGTTGTLSDAGTTTITAAGNR